MPAKRSDETEVRSALKGLARRHDLTVAEVAKRLEAGLWSREHCLGGMRLQWTFEKMCEEDRFAAAGWSEKPAKKPHPPSRTPR